MNKTGFLLRIGRVIILLQGLSYCSEGFQSTSQAIDEKVQEYRNIVSEASLNGDAFVNYTKILGTQGICFIFMKYFEKEFFGMSALYYNEIAWSDESIPKTYLAHLATLAQDSPRCWNAQIKKIEHLIKSTKPGKLTRFKGMFKQQKPPMSAIEIQNSLKEAKFLYEVFLDSAARSYVFMKKEYLKNRASEKWYHIPARLLKTPPDFYILAVLRSIKIHMPEEFENIKNDFLKNFRSYLQKSNMSDSDINNVMKQIEKKSTPSYISRYWKWVLAGVITTVGVSYWIYKNQASYQKGGVSGLFEEAGRQISEKYQKTKEKLFGNKINQDEKNAEKQQKQKKESLEVKKVDQGQDGNFITREGDLETKTSRWSYGNGRMEETEIRNLKTGILEKQITKGFAANFASDKTKIQTTTTNFNPLTGDKENVINDYKGNDLTGKIMHERKTLFFDARGKVERSMLEYFDPKTGALIDQQKYKGDLPLFLKEKTIPEPIETPF